LSFAINLKIGSFKINGITLQYNGITIYKDMGMKKEKRLKTRVVQVRLTPSDFELYEATAKKKNLSKTELFELFLEMIKKEKI